MRARKQPKKLYWQIQEASAKFSQLAEEAQKEGPQLVTKRGDPLVVVISKQLRVQDT